MKKHNIKPDELIVGRQTTCCNNLRVVNIDGRRVMAIAPGLVSLGQGERYPLASYHDTDGHTHILFRTVSPQNGLLITTDDTSVADFALEGAKCAIARRGGFTVMNNSGPHNINLVDGRWQMVDATSIVPDLTLEAVECGEIFFDTKQLTLQDVSFDRTNPDIGERGLKTLRDNLTDAYSSLTATASAAGMWLQPTIARYHLIDSEGRRIFSSSPMVMAINGWQCTGELSTEGKKLSTDSMQIAPLRLSARPYKLKLTICSDMAQLLEAAGIAAVQVTVMPQIHPIDPAAVIPWRITRQSTDTPYLTVTLPGATSSFASLDALRARTLGLLAARADSGSSIVATVDVAPSSATSEIQNNSSTDLSSDIAAIGRVLASKADSSQSSYFSRSLMNEIKTPNSFSAATVAVSGDTVVWGDITPLRSSSINIADLCSNFSDKKFTGVLTVATTEGSIDRIALSGSRMPTAWAPMPFYPDRRVAELTIDLLGDDNTRLQGSINLSPSAAGNLSICTDTSLIAKPFNPTTEPLPDTSQSIAEGDRRPGAVVTCLLDSPLTPVVAIECSHSPVAALIPAVRTQSSWELTRSRFYAFSAEAIHAIVVNSSRNTIAATMIDQRGADSAKAVVATPAGIISLHRGLPVKVIGSKAESIKVPLARYFVSVGWDESTSRLWLVDTNGSLSMADLSSGRWCDIPSPADITRMSTVDNRLWLSDRYELYRVASNDETSAATDGRPIAWAHSIDLPPGARIEAIALEISASMFEGHISLRGRNASSSTPRHKLFGRKLRGSIGAPLLFRTVAPSRRFTSIEIEGAASTDFQIHNISFHHT